MSFIISTPGEAQGGSFSVVMAHRTVMAWAAALGVRTTLNVDERFAPINFDRM